MHRYSFAKKIQSQTEIGGKFQKHVQYEKAAYLMLVKLTTFYTHIFCTKVLCPTFL